MISNGLFLWGLFIAKLSGFNFDVQFGICPLQSVRLGIPLLQLTVGVKQA